MRTLVAYVQATPAMLAFYRAASAEVKAHGAQQLVIANPGVVPARQLAQLVSFLLLRPAACCQASSTMRHDCTRV